MRADDSLPERFRSPRKAAGEVRCPTCGILLAKTENGTLTIRRSEYQAAFVGDGHVLFVCYRPRCHKQFSVPVKSKTIAVDEHK